MGAIRHEDGFVFKHFLDLLTIHGDLFNEERTYQPGSAL